MRLFNKILAVVILTTAFVYHSKAQDVFVRELWII